MMTLKPRGVASNLVARAVVSVLALAVAGSAVYGQQAAPKAVAPKTTPPSPGGSAITGPPNALQGFSQNRDKPIQIDAARLEVRDKDKIATFYGDEKGDVKVVQGDTTMRSKVLVVFYDQDNTSDKKGAAPKAAKAAAPGPGGSSSIRRLEAKGNVIVTQKDQTVTGENGVFDMKTNKVTVTGNVVLTGGDNVVQGDRLVVDMTTSVSQIEVAPGGRVKGLFKSSPQSNDGSKSAPAQGNGGKSNPFGGIMGGSR